MNLRPHKSFSPGRAGGAAGESQSARNEWGRASLMSLYFFLVITVFWMLKPIKKAMLTGLYTPEHPFHFLGRAFVGGEAEQLAKLGNMLVAVLATAAVTALSRRFVRHALSWAVGSFFVLCLIGYSLVIAHASPLVAWSFYLFGDLWAIVMVAVFFAFLNDSVTPEEAKRVYGWVGFGGVLGGAVGSNFTGFLVQRLGPEGIVLSSLAATLGILYIAGAVARHYPAARAVEHSTAQIPARVAEGGSAFTEGARLVFSSRYLLAIMAMVGAYEIISTLLDFQFTQTVLSHGRELGWDKAATGAYFAKIFGFTNLLALGVQLFLTSWIMRRFGVGVALMTTPVLQLLASFSFLAAPMILTAASLSIIDNAFNYSINQSAREALYVPVSQREKYRAKCFIDMFTVRFAKALAVGLNLTVPLWVGAGVMGLRALSVAVIVLLVGWLILARYAGRNFRRLETVGP